LKRGECRGGRLAVGAVRRLEVVAALIPAPRAGWRLCERDLDLDEPPEGDLPRTEPAGVERLLFFAAFLARRRAAAELAVESAEAEGLLERVVEPPRTRGARTGEVSMREVMALREERVEVVEVDPEGPAAGEPRVCWREAVAL
jgi:hypothetical protein